MPDTPLRQRISIAEINAALGEEKRLDIFYNQIPVYFIFRPIGLVFCILFHRLGLSPITVTSLGLLLALMQPFIAFFAANSFPQSSEFAGALALGLTLAVLEILDAVDGDLARATGQTSALGGLMDAITDQVKKFVYLITLGALIQFETTETLFGLGHFGLAFGLGTGGLLLLARVTRDSAKTTDKQDVYPFRRSGRKSFSQLMFHSLASLEYAVSILLPVFAWFQSTDILLACLFIYALSDFMLSFVLALQSKR